MPDTLIWTYVVLAAVLAGCVVAFLVTQRRKGAVLKRLARTLGARVAGNTFTARSGDTSYRVTYFERTGPSQWEPMQTGLRIGVSCPSRGSFSIVSADIERAYSEDFGEGETVRTGDPEFDRNFLVQSTAVGFVSAFFAAPERRRAIQRIFALGGGVVRHDGDVVETMWFFRRAEPRDVDLSAVTALVAQLSALAKDLARG
jgi:hypothetical protein